MVEDERRTVERARVSGTRRKFVCRSVVYEDEEISAYSRDQDSRNPNETKLFLKARPYVAPVGQPGAGGSLKTTTFFTTFPPDQLFTQLANLLQSSEQDREVEFDVKPPHWKITFTVYNRLNKDGEATSPNAQAAGQMQPENEEAKAEVVPVYEYVRMQAEILRVIGQAKFAVSFTRKGGAAWLFYATVDNYMKQLQLYHDATLEDTAVSAQ